MPISASLRATARDQIFVKGEVIKTVLEAQIVETLIAEAMRLAEELEPSDEDAGASASAGPSVTVV